MAFAAPSVVSRSWVGGSGDSPSGQVLGRALGGRDLALGLGALTALRLQAVAASAAVWEGAVSTAPSTAPLPSADPSPAGPFGIAESAGPARASGSAAAAWVGLAALADGLDLVITARSWGDLPPVRRWLVALSSGGAAVVGLAGAVSLLATPSPRSPGERRSPAEPRSPGDR